MHLHKIFALLPLLLVPLAFGAASDLYLDPIWINGPENSMGPRLYHSLVQDSEGNIWTFGGVTDVSSGIGESNNEVWKLDVKNNFTWINLTTTGEVPTARAGYQIWILKDIIYIYSGSTESLPLPDMYSLDTKTLIWSAITDFDPATSPGFRYYSATWLDEDTEILWLFGGYNSKVFPYFLKDVWYFNITSANWTYVSTAPDAEGTMYSQAVKDRKGIVWIFGGETYQQMSQLLRYDPATNVWTFIGGAIGGYAEPVYGTIGEYGSDTWPSPLSRGNCVYSGSDIITYFGGTKQRSDSDYSMVAVDQVWSFNTTSQQWAFIRGDMNNTESAPLYSSLLQSSPSNKIGSRANFGISGSILGHLWVHGGSYSTNSSTEPVTGTFVLPINLCLTEFNPCNINTTCTPNGLTVTCTCPDGYVGNGIGDDGCTPAPPQVPLSQPASDANPTAQPMSEQPAKTPHRSVSSGSFFQASVMTIVCSSGLFLF